jgi:hypothetical protein
VTTKRLREQGSREEIKPIAVRRAGAAAMLGVSTSQIDRLRRRGVLRAVQLEDGGDFLYPVADIEAPFADRHAIDVAEREGSRSDLEPPRRQRRLAPPST